MNSNGLLINGTTLTVNIKYISQFVIIKIKLKTSDEEVIEQNNKFINPEIIKRLEKHLDNFRKLPFKKKSTQD